MVNKKKDEEYNSINIDSNKINYLRDYGTGTSLLPIWKNKSANGDYKYPPIRYQNGCTDSCDYQQIYKSSDKDNPWIDHTKIIAEKLITQSFTRLFKDRGGVYKHVTIKGLTSKNGILMNGLKARIVDEYDFDRQRWPIQIISKENNEYYMKCFKLKSINLQVIK